MNTNICTLRCVLSGGFLDDQRNVLVQTIVPALLQQHPGQRLDGRLTEDYLVIGGAGGRGGRGHRGVLSEQSHVQTVPHVGRYAVLSGQIQIITLAINSVGRRILKRN